VAIFRYYELCGYSCSFTSRWTACSDIGWACSTGGGEERCIHDFGWGKLKEGDDLEDLDKMGG
jgi:hypothetical protein